VPTTAPVFEEELCCFARSMMRAEFLVSKNRHLLEKILEQDPDWKEFSSAAAEARKKIQQT